MDDDREEREAALLELRHDMLKFILDEIAIRVDKGASPKLEAKIDGIVKARVEETVAQVARETIDEQARILADEVVAYLESKAHDGSEVRHKPRPADNNADDKRSEKPNPSFLGLSPTQWARASWAALALIGGLVVALVAISMLYASQKAESQSRGATISERSDQLHNVCGLRQHALDEAALLRDDKAWRNQCTGNNIAKPPPRACSAERRLEALAADIKRFCE